LLPLREYTKKNNNKPKKKKKRIERSYRRKDSNIVQLKCEVRLHAVSLTEGLIVTKMVIILEMNYYQNGVRS